jgi:GT2 family glycosyltransferase
VILGIGGVAGHAHKRLQAGDHGYFQRAVLTQSLSAVTAACLVVRKKIYQEVGGLDEENLQIAFNDIDFCLRVRDAGYRNVWTPHAELLHHESATRGDDVAPEKKIRFDREVQYMLRRWGAALKEDPAYNPNLTLDFEDFSYAWPPRLPPLA